MREIVIAYDGKRYRVFFREGAIESYVHYRKTLQGAKSLARLWQEEEEMIGGSTEGLSEIEKEGSIKDSLVNIMF